MIAAMGLDIRAGGHVSFDLEDRPLKSPRPFCSVLRAPTEVVLVLRPVGGLTDYAAFLHELGHALHFGHVDPSLPWEFRHLGDNSITEGFAFVFDRLSVDATWLREVIGLTEPQGLARTLALRELMMSRKYAAQFLWELDLFSDDEPQARRASWAEAIGRATGVQQSPANYLGSVDPVFYCARYLQGWLFEAVLSERLRADLGPAWFHEPAAGERLLALYRRGQDRPVAALFGELDAAPLTIEPLLQRAARELG